MNKADYISRVNALDLPEGLREKLAALPNGTGTRTHSVRPYGRWAAIAATLVLVAGLGIATPAILRAIAPPGGDITNPPFVTPTPTTTAMPVDPWGISLITEKVTATGLTLVCEQSGGAPAGELLTGSWYRVDRLEGRQWREVPIIAVGNMAWTSEGWIIPRDDTQRWNVNWEWLYGVLPDGTYRIAKNILDSRAPGDYDEKAYYAEFTIGSTLAIPDEELAELLAVEFPDEATVEDTWELLGSDYSTAGFTMGVLQYEWGGGSYMQADFSNLLLGVFDNAAKKPVGPVIRFNGQFTYALPYTTGSAGQDYYVLCISKNYGQGMAENYRAAIFYFDGLEVRQVAASPHAGLPERLEGLFDPENGGAFWEEMNYKIIPAPSGFELFYRNGSHGVPGDESGGAYWLYDCYVPLAYKFPDTGVMAAVRRHFVKLYEDFPEGSSDYSIQLCEPVPGYNDPDYPNAHAYHVILGDEWNSQMDRYFLFDESGTLLGVRSTPDLSLTFDGKTYSLGIGTRNIFGMPSATNSVPMDDGQYENYSEWFDPNANACGYTYYPASGRYYLTNMNTVREDVYTARGIHVGSTVAELIAAYPEADWGDFQGSSGARYSNGSAEELQFEFERADSHEEALTRSITSISLVAGWGYWPEP